jgi:hypothetical protein
LVETKQKKRSKSRRGSLGLVFLIVAFVGIAFLIASPPGSHTSPQATGNEDAFYGTMGNVFLKDVTSGVVKADTNCKPVQNGLTNCIGIIDAADGTELHFNYSHDMSKQACLAAGNNITIIPLSDGTVKIIRK